MADAPRSLPLAEAARRLGHYVWVERRLFEILGRWVPAVAELEAKLLVGSHSFHHAWHAELLHERLPMLAGIDRVDLAIAPSIEFGAFMRAVAEPVGTVEKLVGVYRVVIPRLIATYGAHLRSAAPIADAPTIRALELVVGDESEDMGQGEIVIESLLTTPDEVSRAAAHHRRLEGLLGLAGGIAGPRG